MGRGMKYNKYNTEEDWAKCHPDNRELVKEYLMYLKATNKSKTTTEKYEHNLKLFMVWLLHEVDNIPFAKVTKRHVMRWMAYLQDTGVSSNRIRTLRSTVSSCANFIENILSDEDERYEGFRNIILKVPAPVKENLREKVFLTEEQIDVLMQYLILKEKWREALYVHLSFVTAARKHEIAQFKKSDFAEDTLKDGFYRTLPKHVKSRSSLKTRQFLIPRTELLDMLLEKWISSRTDELEDLFVTYYKGECKPVGNSTFNEWCDTFAKILGTHVHPHGFRSSRANGLKDDGKSMDKIKVLLGHQSVETTALYTKPSDEDDILDLYN